MERTAPACRTISVGTLRVSNDLPMVLIAGPCQIESRDHALMMARALSDIAAGADVPFIFKSSFDKANRTSITGQRGLGLEQGLAVLGDIRREVGCPVMTDIHEPAQCAPAAEVADILQIPAFLCRQTDLLVGAGRTGAAINVKKGQFLAPWDMQHVADKIASTGNHRIFLCERGTCFGYNRLVTDLCSLPIMARTGYPVVIDATHSVQQPGGQGEQSGGERVFAPLIARAAVAIGVAAVFIEAHDNPDHAPSDGPNMVSLSDMPDLLHLLASLDRVAKSNSAKDGDATATITPGEEANS